MRRVFVLMMAISMIFVFASCGGNSAEDTSAEEPKTATEETAEAEETPTAAAPERDLPEGSYEDKGDGGFFLASPSGSTRDGADVVLFPDKNSSPMAFLDYELEDMDGSVQTFLYIDGVEMDKQQVGAGYASSFMLGEDSLFALTDGEHKVEAVQYADNDPSGEMTFYRAETYTVKNE